VNEDTERLATEEDRAAAMGGLTAKMERLLAKVTDTPTLAYDLAQEAEVDNQAAGPVLTALFNRHLIQRVYDEDESAWRYYQGTPPG
jgi:hypothetical protein